MKLIIGGIEVPIHASLSLRQTYEPIGGSTVLRMQSGAAIKQTHWRKLRTSIQADGWIPPGLDAIDYSQPLQLACVATRSMMTSALVVDLPAARRSDAGYTPVAWALVGGGWQSAAVAMDGNEATITPVAGASRYKIDYYPLLTVFTDGPSEEVDATNAAFRWTLSAEEV
jgi:hypothetical protein